MTRHAAPRCAVALSTLMILGGLSAPVSAQVPELVADVDMITTLDSSPGPLVDVNGILYFRALAGAETGLWRSDGTTKETVLVKPFASGPSHLVNVGGVLFFTTVDEATSTLWKSDGTEAGTVPVKPGISQPSGLTAVGGTLYFVASQDATGLELWTSDGTAAGTLLVKDINPGPDSSLPQFLTNVGGTLYFTAQEPVGGTELWKSDGTAAGTVRVKDIAPGAAGSAPAYLTGMGNTLFFSASSGLWKTDGTEPGTIAVKAATMSGFQGPERLTNVGGTLFFGAHHPDTGYELWKSDGTTTGTVLVKDINPGPSESRPNGLTNVNGTLYFTAYEPVSGNELWKSDGTAAGTVLVKDIVPGALHPAPADLTSAGGRLFFRKYLATFGEELWTSDGTSAGTYLVKDTSPGPGSSSPRWLTSVRGTLYFTANDRATGRELWRSDGTTAGTELVRDINTAAGGAHPQNLTDVSGTLFFTLDEPVHGAELWKSDGTSAGTVLVRDGFPGPIGSDPRHLTRVGGILYFTARDPNLGVELWRSDGTTAGTVVVKDIHPGAGDSSPEQLTRMGDILYFRAADPTSGDELWRSDGTAAGTVRVGDINPGPAGSSIGELTSVQGVLYFAALDPTHGRELWKLEGTGGGPELVKDIAPGSESSHPYDMAAVGNTLFFAANHPAYGLEPWKSDGTAAGTVLLADIVPGASWSTPDGMTAVDGTVYFTARHTTPDIRELWKSDGTTEGTVPVLDVRGVPPVWVAGLTRVGGSLYFEAQDTAFESEFGRELWTSDGTRPGTRLVEEIFPGPNVEHLSGLSDVNGTLYFRAEAPGTGRELWRSDGTPEGTVLVGDIRPGTGSSSPRHVTAMGAFGYFAADDGTNGPALWRVPAPHPDQVLPSGVTSVGHDLVVQSVAGNPGGAHVVVWTRDAGPVTGWDVHAQRYDADGNAVGAPIVVATAPGSQIDPSVAMDDTGRFVVVWEHQSSGGDGSHDAYFRVHGSDGLPLTGPVRANTTTGLASAASRTSRPSVALSRDGSFFVVAFSLRAADGSDGVYLRRFLIDGTPLDANDIWVDEVAAVSHQYEPAVAVAAGGQYVVVWQTDEMGTTDVNARLFTAGGIADTVIPVAADPGVQETTPAVAATAGGGFVVTWVSEAGDARGKEIAARQFDAAGNGGPVLAVNSTSHDDQAQPSIAVDENGDFAVSWASMGQDGDDQGVYLQRFDATGQRQCVEMRVNTHILDRQDRASMAYLQDGAVVVGWTGLNQAACAACVYTRILPRPRSETAPVELVASASGPYEVTLTWTESGAEVYEVHRATNSGGPYSLIGTAAGSPFVDRSVPGGIPVFYVLRAPAAASPCTSSLSNRATVVTTGTCAEAPAFGGAVSATGGTSGSCSIQLAWDAASGCPDARFTYSIHRSTSPGFSPSPENRVATGIVETSWTDLSPILPGVSYHYVVRASDTATGWTDANATVRTATATGCACSSAAQEPRDAPIEEFWVTNGPVGAVVEAHGKVFLSGAFTRVGPRTGGGAVIDVGSGSVTVPASKVEGTVSSVAPDGAGGWYLTGGFTMVGGHPRDGNVHLLADGTVSRWRMPGAAADARIAAGGGRVYRIEDGLVTAFDPASAAEPAVPLWSAAIDGAGEAIAYANGRVYIGGSFCNVGASGNDDCGVSALDAATGTVLWSSSALSPGSLVTSLAVSGQWLFVGGSFASPQPNLMAVDARTGAHVSWAAEGANERVHGLAVADGVVYAVGDFSAIAGTARQRFAGVSTTTSSVVTPPHWVLPPSPSGTTTTTFASAVAAGEDAVYVGGSFGGEAFVEGETLGHGRLAWFRPSDGAILPWTIVANDTIGALAVSGGELFAAGAFSSLGMQERHGIAALDSDTGSLSSWYPPGGMNAPARSLQVQGSRLYLGGAFTEIGGQARTGLAALDVDTAAVLAWNPELSGPPGSSVLDLGIHPTGLIHVAGSFAAVNGVPRNGLAALDESGAVMAWDPRPDGDEIRRVTSSIDGSRVFVAGSFLHIGDPAQTRPQLAAISPDSPIVLAWTPDPSGTVLALSPRADVGLVVAGDGDFGSAGDGSRTGGASYSSALDMEAFDPQASGPILDVTTDGCSAVAGGGFTQIGSGNSPRSLLAVLDLATSNANAWDPAISGDHVARTAVTGSRIYAAGRFTGLAGKRRPHFAAFCKTGSAPTSVTASPAGDNRIDILWSGGPGTVYRSRTSGGPWERVGSGSDSYSDVAVHGGVTYYYTVRGTGGGCESTDSSEVAATASGTCMISPDFEGAASAAGSASACSVEIRWRPATHACGGAVRYAVYRDEIADFVPGPTNRIADDLADVTGYTDSGIQDRHVYYYQVTASVNEVEDGNRFQHVVTPTGCAVAAPDSLPFFAARSGDGENVLEWVNPAAMHDSTVILSRTDTYPTRPSDPLAQLVGSFPAPAGAFDAHVHGGLRNGSTYYYGAWVSDGSGRYSAGRFTLARPDSAPGPIAWAYGTGASTLAQPAVLPGEGYWVVSNDGLLHALTPGAAGGLRPPGWTPYRMAAPSQDRPTVVVLAAPVSGASRLALVSSHDGRVHAINAEDGTLVWSSPLLGTTIQGSPATLLIEQGGLSDLVVVASRGSGGEGRLHGLNLADGTVAWTFDNGGGPDAIGLISSQPAVQPVESRVCFTSRRHAAGSSSTVWCLSVGAASAAKLWSADVGDVDAAPAIAGTVVYVGTRTGQIHALDVASGDVRWPSPYTMNPADGAVKGYLVPSEGRVYFTTESQVHAIQDNGAGISATSFWTAPRSVPGASPPLLDSGRLYVGGDHGHIYSFDAMASSPPVPDDIVVGDPASPAAVGTPALDHATGLLVVGTEEGLVYGIALSGGRR